jgi:hypothetical protein
MGRCRCHRRMSSIRYHFDLDKVCTNRMNTFCISRIKRLFPTKELGMREGFLSRGAEAGLEKEVAPGPNLGVETTGAICYRAISVSAFKSLLGRQISLGPEHRPAEAVLLLTRFLSGRFVHKTVVAAICDCQLF